MYVYIYIYACVPFDSTSRIVTVDDDLDLDSQTLKLLWQVIYIKDKWVHASALHNYYYGDLCIHCADSWKNFSKKKKEKSPKPRSPPFCYCKQICAGLFLGSGLLSWTS